MLSIPLRVATNCLMGAVVMAQVMGIRAGYVCACNDQEQPVASANCDAEDCHPGRGHPVQSPVAGTGEDEKEYPHNEQRDNLVAIGISTLVQSIKPAPAVELSSLCVTLNSELHAPHRDRFARPERSRGHHPPDQLRVIQSVELLS